MKRSKKTVGLGGTFDHFHRGHEEFLNFAHDLGEHLLIGITAQHMTQEKQHASQIQSYRERVFNVRRYCQSQGMKHRVIKLEDLYGPTLEPHTITELAVTDETLNGAQQINTTREVMGMRRLPVNVFHRIQADDGEFISSSRIRAGRIDREGRVYADLFTDPIQLNQDARAFFSEIQGEVVETVTSQKPSSVDRRIVVGDVTLARFLEEQWEFDLGIFDGKSEREASENISETITEQAFHVPNPAGSIQPRLVDAIRDTGRRFIFVEGEEDLAVIPAVLLLPLSAEVYYGQPDEGMVQIKITADLKHSFQDALSLE